MSTEDVKTTIFGYIMGSRHLLMNNVTLKKKDPNIPSMVEMTMQFKNPDPNESEHFHDNFEVFVGANRKIEENVKMEDGKLGTQITWRFVDPQSLEFVLEADHEYSKSGNKWKVNQVTFATSRYSKSAVLKHTNMDVETHEWTFDDC